MPNRKGRKYSSYFLRYSYGDIPSIPIIWRQFASATKLGKKLGNKHSILQHQKAATPNRQNHRNLL